MTNIIIIGAGISGLACARLLADAGLNVIGVATRRARAKGNNFPTYCAAYVTIIMPPRGSTMRESFGAWEAPACRHVPKKWQRNLTCSSEHRLAQWCQTGRTAVCSTMMANWTRVMS